VARIWRDHELKPWKADRFKVSKDPRFEEKLVAVVAMYVSPPERAVFSPCAASSVTVGSRRLDVRHLRKAS
jgi:hypothetical protein